MVVEGDDQSGQSIIEFLILFPMIIGLAVTLVRINTAIQISIVNQQYARAQTLFLTYNNAFYPSLDHQSNAIAHSMNQMVLGVADNTISPTGEYVPAATVQNITRMGGAQGSDEPKVEPNLRSKVRIRNTVTLCAPNRFIGGQQPILDISNSFPFTVLGPVNLSDHTQFMYCGSGLAYDP